MIKIILHLTFTCRKLVLTNQLIKEPCTHPFLQVETTLRESAKKKKNLVARPLMPYPTSPRAFKDKAKGFLLKKKLVLK